MNINNEIYGDRSTWIIKKNDNSKTIYTMSNIITESGLDRKKNLDSSICFVGTKYEDFLGNHERIINGYTLEVQNNDYTSSQIFFGDNSRSVSSYAMEIFRIENNFPNPKDVFFPTANQSGSVINENFNLITDFDYSRAIILIELTVYKEDWSDGKYSTLYDYVNNVDNISETYPIVHTLHYNLYYDTTDELQTSSRRSSTTCELLACYNRETIVNVNTIITSEYKTIAHGDMREKLGGWTCDARMLGTLAKATEEKPYYYRTYYDDKYWINDIVSTAGSATAKIYLDWNAVGRGHLWLDEYCKKQIACLGLWFTDKKEIALNPYLYPLNSTVTNEHIYIPYIDDAGYTDGTYFAGSNAATQKNANWTNNPYQNTGYEGEKDIDKNKYTDNMPLATQGISALGSFNNTYICNVNDVKALGQYMWSGSTGQNWLDNFLPGLSLYGENPIDCIISVKMFPFDIRNRTGLPISTAKTAMKIGRNLATGVTGYQLTNDIRNIVLTYDDVVFPRYSNTFLDYEPYTTAEIYVPYCGMYSIDVNKCLGKSITIKIIIDLLTGACTSCIYSDGVLIKQIDGLIGYDLALSGRDNASYSQGLLNNIMGVATSAGAAMTGNVGAVVGVASNIADMTFSTPSIINKNSSTPNINFSLPQNAYLIIHKPSVQIPSDYGHNVGYACMITKNVKSFEGYTVFSDFDTSAITATETEKTLIKNLMLGGIYI